MNIEKDNSPLTQKERIARIRAMHRKLLAEKGQVQSIDLEALDETEKENVPTDEKLESILKCTNGQSRGNFFDNVDGSENDE